MIQADRSDHCKQWILYRIGGVKPPAQPCLQNNILHGSAVKSLHPHPIQEFKVGRMSKAFLFHILRGVRYLPENLKKQLVLYRLPVYLNPLIDRNKVGRSKKSASFPFCLEDRLNIGAYRAFSVCPGHMDHLTAMSRVSQPFHKFLCMLQRMLPGEPWEFLYIFHCFSIIYRHFFWHYSSPSSCFVHDTDVSVPVPSITVSCPP